MTKIQTFTRRMVDPLALRAEDIDIVDIARALSMICRYNGHCSRFYSVAEHSVLVSLLAPPALKLAALLHDAAEAYLGDIPSPLKRRPEMGAYRAAEARAESAIAQKFGLRPAELAAVAPFDREIYASEYPALMRGPHEWRVYSEAIAAGARIVPIPGWEPRVARDRFTSRFHRLTRARVREMIPL